MGNCDLCNDTIGSSAQRFSAADVRQAVSNGIRPQGAAKAIGAALGVDDSLWVSMVMADRTGWALCPSCASLMATYLGEPVKTRDFFGETEEEARTAAAQAGIAPEKIQETKLARQVEDGFVTAQGAEASLACDEAKKKVPPEAFAVSSPEIIQTGEQGTVEVQDETEDGARRNCAKHMPDAAVMVEITCTTPPKSGFLGIGKRPGVYLVKWAIPFRARVAFKLPARVTVTYKE